MVSPLSTEPIEAESQVEIPAVQAFQGKAKYPARFNRSQSQSLRTRNLKGIIDSRLKKAAAEPFEALRVAQEIEKLVSRCMKTACTVPDSKLHSPRDSGHMRISAVDMTYSREIWASSVN
jgi:hypothetical protein